MRSGWRVVFDALALVLFATVGRASHHEALTLAGTAETAWPFLVAGLVASIACLVGRVRRPYDGVLVWASAVLGGMGLRVATGGTTAPAFVVVATLTLGVLLLGWRTAADLRKR